jgi:hypothetical protein
MENKQLIVLCYIWGKFWKLVRIYEFFVRIINMAPHATTESYFD